jgi:hypothetical protein
VGPGLIQKCDWSAIDVLVSDHVPGDVISALADNCAVITAPLSTAAGKPLRAAEWRR